MRKENNEMIYISEPQHADEIDQRKSMYPSIMRVIKNQPKFIFTEDYSHSFIYVLDGELELISDGFKIKSIKGACFAVPGVFTIESSSNYTAIQIEKLGYLGMFGATQIEKKGRLAYIDGCSDTTLFQPARMGDPVLNYLHFPKQITQTQHLHPSIRFGIVTKGSGVAWKGTNCSDPGWEIELKKGGIFCLNESAIHSFKTKDSEMDIVAFHPDSDTGPTDQNHAMINRTYINHGK